MFRHHTPVLHDPDPRAREPFGDGSVPDAELQPDDGRPHRQGENLLRVRREMSWRPEDLDDVNGLPEVPEGIHRADAVNGLPAETRVHGDDAVALRGEIGRHEVRGLTGRRLGTEHGDGASPYENAPQALVIVDEVRAPVGHAAQYTGSPDAPSRHRPGTTGRSLVRGRFGRGQVGPARRRAVGYLMATALTCL